jgi:hypothetical protein
MAVRQKRTGTPGGENIKNAIMAKAAELWDAHCEEVLRVIKESEEHKLTVTFGSSIDCSESAPSITIAMRFSETFTDSRKVQLDDPDQGTFADVVAAAESEPPKKRGRNQKPIQEATE